MRFGHNRYYSQLPTSGQVSGERGKLRAVSVRVWGVHGFGADPSGLCKGPSRACWAANDGGMSDIEGLAPVPMPHWPMMPGSRAAGTFGPNLDAAVVLRLVVFALTPGSLLAVLR
jgi:hypothetical protein